VRGWWEREFSKFPVVEGHHNVGLFNRSAAVNTAATLAGDWRTAIIIDSDVICHPPNVFEAIELANSSGRMVLPYDVRKDLNAMGSEAIMTGYKGNWNKFVRLRYTDGVSNVVVLTRALWDAVGGLDPAFQGWGWEDNAFRAACWTFSGGPELRIPGEVWHFYHRSAKTEAKGTPSWAANQARAERYRTNTGDKDAIRAIRAETVSVDHGSGIPRILHRVVPADTTVQAEEYWRTAQRLHPDWRFMTHRDPLVPDAYPLTSGAWDAVEAGAQLADLVRLEVLYVHGGVYVDQDYEPYRPFDSLLGAQVFAAYEDRTSVPNAVLGSVPNHPAIKQCLDLAVQRVKAHKGVWNAGPGVTTQVFTSRDDVLLLPPGAFYPYHYKEKEKAGVDHKREQPWAFGAHHWWHSWKGH